MAEIIQLPTAAVQPVVNPKRRGRQSHSGFLVLAMQLKVRRALREQERRKAAEAIAVAEQCERWAQGLLHAAAEHRAMAAEAAGARHG